jgi:hypothetical protein
MACARFDQHAGALVDRGVVAPEFVLLPSEFQSQVVDLVVVEFIRQPAQQRFTRDRAA